MEFIYGIIAFFLLWFGADIGRKDDSKLKSYSKDWFLQLVVFIVASLIFRFLA